MALREGLLLPVDAGEEGTVRRWPAWMSWRAVAVLVLAAVGVSGGLLAGVKSGYVQELAHPVTMEAVTDPRRWLRSPFWAPQPQLQQHLQPQPQHHTVCVADGRCAVVYAPPMSPSLRGQRRAAIFVLHGSYEAPSDYFHLGFEEVAAQRSFLMVYPEMPGRGYDWGYINDLPYFSELVKRLEADFAMNPEETFVCGHSAGGTMALYLQNQDKVPGFRRAASVSAGVAGLEDVWQKGRKGRTMLIYNRNDPVVRGYMGETVSFLLQGAPAQQTLLAEHPLEVSGSGEVVDARIAVYGGEGLPELRTVQWASNPGRHGWPTAGRSFSATELIIDFFFPTSPPVARGPLRLAEVALAARIEDHSYR